MIETHFHLDYLKQASNDEIIQNSKAAGVEKFLTISVSPNNFEIVLQLADQFPEVYATQGFHPHEAMHINQELLTTIELNAKTHAKVIAIGEIGLDYHYDKSPRDKQKEVFKQQLDIAIKLDLPVVIHTRDADDDTLTILKEYAPQMKRKGVLHSFTSSPELASAALKLGFHIGFNGIITFKSAQNVRDIVALCPLDQMLLETDAPFLTPVPHRGKENAPFYLPFIAQKIAEIKNISVEEVIKTTTQNALNVFKF